MFNFVFLLNYFYVCSLAAVMLNRFSMIPLDGRIWRHGWGKISPPPFSLVLFYNIILLIHVHVYRNNYRHMSWGGGGGPNFPKLVIQAISDQDVFCMNLTRSLSDNGLAGVGRRGRKFSYWNNTDIVSFSSVEYVWQYPNCHTKRLMRNW